jgi:Peptidase M15
MIDPILIEKLNQLKAVYPCSTLSLDRTPHRNASVGGAQASWHLTTTPGGAKAVDLVFDTQAELLPAAILARTLGFGGIELDYRNLHLHLDMRPTIWHVVCSTDKTETLNEYLTRYQV